MAQLSYTAIASLDGFIEDEGGRFDWAEPEAEVHAFINDRQRHVGTYLYGRRMYEVMAGWETDPSLATASPLMRDFAEIWQAAEKVVFSTTLDRVVTAHTRLERTLEPEAIRRMKASATRDLAVSGPGLATHAFRAGLVDELDLYLVPILVGGGKRALPSQVLQRLELLDQVRFDSGVVHVRYRVLP
jgi:dihydrofolate reductase